MRYTFFEFQNFKGIRKTRIDLSPRGSEARIHTLVGLNESGKTTVLEAIDFFQGAHGEDEVSPKELAGWQPPSHDELIPIAEADNFNGEVSIHAGIKLDEDDLAAAQAHLLKGEDPYLLHSLNAEFSIRDVYRYENSQFVDKNSYWANCEGTWRAKRKGKVDHPLKSSKDPKWRRLSTFLRSQLPTIWLFPNFLFDFPARIYLEERDGESKLNQFYRVLFQDILSAIDDGYVVETHVIERARSEEAAQLKHLEQLGVKVERQITSEVISAWNDMFTDKRITDKEIRLKFGVEEEDGSARAGVYVEFSLKDADGIFSISQRSLGFRWFFVYLLMTLYRGRRAGAGNEMLFLFDEPASNLHSSAQATLLKSLDDLSERAEVIYTTHSHHLIEPAWLGSTFVVANQGLDPRESISPDYTAGRTDICVEPYRTFAAQHPDQAQYFQPILDTLDYAPSKLEMVHSVVMVEGKSDYYTLRYFQDIIFKSPAKEYLNFLPGGGAGSLDDPIRLYLAWGRPFIAMLDADKSGQRERERYIEKFGQIVEERLTDAREASGNTKVKAIESLLPKEDKLAIVQVGSPDLGRYTKDAFARGVQEALATKTEVKISKEGRKVMKALLQSLRKHLSEVENG